MRPNPTQATALAELLCEVGHVVYAGADQSGLKAAQWSALRFIASANRNAASIGSFARLYRITPSSASQTITSLARRRLVKKAAAEDGRARSLVLTPAGRAMMKQDPLRKLSRIIGRLAGGQFSSLTGIIEKLIVDLA